MSQVESDLARKIGSVNAFFPCDIENAIRCRQAEWEQFYSDSGGVTLEFKVSGELRVCRKTTILWQGRDPKTALGWLNDAVLLDAYIRHRRGL